MRESLASKTVLDRIFFITERVVVFDGIDDVFAHIVRTAVQITHSEAATIRMFDLRTGLLKIVKGYGVSTGFLSQPDVRIGEGITGRVVLHGQPYATANVLKTPHCVHKEFARMEGIRSVLSVPLKSKESTLGCITVYRKKAKVFSEQDLIILSIFAAQAAEAVEKMQLIDDLQRQAMYDLLTGVYNKNAILAELDSRVKLANRHGHQTSVLFIDLDDFKSFNDTHGHLLGDKLLCDFARLISGHCRKSDVIGRFGGEEFVVVAPNTTRSGAVRLAGKLLSITRQYKFTGTDGPTHVTFSAGISSTPKDGADGFHLLKKADDAMYAAKEAGKNRVLLSREGE